MTLRNALWLLVAPLAVSSARGELIPSFELKQATRNARIVVQGLLNGQGKLKPTKVHYGQMDVSKSVVINQGAHYFLSFRKLIPEDQQIEVIAFLYQRGPGNYQTFWGDAGVIALHENDVFGRLDFSKSRSPRMGKSQKYQRKTFLAALAGLLTEERKLRPILALPPSNAKSSKLLEYLKTCDPKDMAQIYRIARGLRPRHPEEQKLILNRINNAKNITQQILLLKVAKAIPLPKEAFPALVKWTEPKYANELRAVAIEACAQTDWPRAVEHFTAHLRLDDPQMATMINILNWRGELDWRNPKVLDAILRMARDLRKAQREKGPDALRRESFKILGAMDYYPHPRLLPVLAEWGWQSKHKTAEYALETLKEMTDLHWGAEDHNQWQKWWAKHKSILAKKYSLKSKAGLKEWLQAHNSGDPSDQKLLLSLWRYEKGTDLMPLLREAKGTLSTSAKAVLAYLWEKECLPASLRKAIIKEFLEVKLVEKPNPHPRSPNWRELQIVFQKHFPFPDHVPIEPRSAIAVGNRKLKLSDSWGWVNLSESKVGGSMGGGFPGATTARAIFEMRQKPSRGSTEEEWRLQWHLGPIKLSKRKP